MKSQKANTVHVSKKPEDGRAEARPYMAKSGKPKGDARSTRRASQRERRREKG